MLGLLVAMAMSMSTQLSVSPTARLTLAQPLSNTGLCR